MYASACGNAGSNFLNNRTLATYAAKFRQECAQQLVSGMYDVLLLGDAHAGRYGHQSAAGELLSSIMKRLDLGVYGNQVRKCPRCGTSTPLADPYLIATLKVLPSSHKSLIENIRRSLQSDENQVGRMVGVSTNQQICFLLLA